MAFQRSAYQNNAFQEGVAAVVAAAKRLLTLVGVGR
jgi:hypothetical protein